MASKCYCYARSGWGFGYGDDELTGVFRKILVSLRTEFLQNAALIGSARILRKVLEPEAKGGRLPLIE